MAATCNKDSGPTTDSTNMRIVLLGTPGAGKSATGNTILGREVFREETGSGKCVLGKREVEGRSITVIDTPGIYNTTLTKEQLNEEMEKCISLSSPGPNVFLLVIRLERFTQEDRNALSWIQENFGEEALSYTMVLFTGREKVTRKQWEDFERTETTKQPISVCGGGYYALNSKPEVHTTQVTELLRKIEEMVERDGGEYYLEERCQEAQRKIREEQEREKRKVEINERKGKLERREEEVRRMEEVLRKSLEEVKRIEEDLMERQKELQEKREEFKKVEKRTRQEEEDKLIEKEQQKREENLQKVKEEARKQENKVNEIEEDLKLAQEHVRKIAGEVNEIEEVMKREEQRRSEQNTQEKKKIVEVMKREIDKRKREEQKREEEKKIEEERKRE
ncbi:golgin subfamily A member 6-like protein 6, partial [Salmo trutta]